MNNKKYIKSDAYRGYILRVDELFGKYTTTVMTRQSYNRGSSLSYDNIEDSLNEGKKIV